MARKREQKATDENKILKLEKELMKLKGTKPVNTDAAKLKLEIDKLKESLKSCRTLHREQIQMKDVRISDQQATIKSLNSKINTLEKSLSKLKSQFNDFQRQSAVNLAKLSHQKKNWYKSRIRRRKPMKKARGKRKIVRKNHKKSNLKKLFE